MSAATQQVESKRRPGQRGPRKNFPRSTADVRHGSCDSPFYTVKQFCKRNPAFTEGQVRWWIFKAEENGLEESGAIIRNGRSIVIDEPAFFPWFRSKKSAA